MTNYAKINLLTLILTLMPITSLSMTEKEEEEKEALFIAEKYPYEYEAIVTAEMKKDYDHAQTLCANQINTLNIAILKEIIMAASCTALWVGINPATIATGLLLATARSKRKIPGIIPISTYCSSVFMLPGLLGEGPICYNGDSSRDKKWFIKEMHAIKDLKEKNNYAFADEKLTKLANTKN